MWIIAIETSTRSASIAVASPDGRITQKELPTDVKTAVSLVPTLRDLCNACGLRPREVERVALSIGPGSFTGLRIGATTAKLIAFAAHARLMAVSTLEVLAHQAAQHDGRTWTFVDGQRNDLVGAAWDYRLGEPPQLAVPTRLRPLGEWGAFLAPGDQVVPCQLRQPFIAPADVSVLSGSICIPQAATVANLARRAANATEPDRSIEASWQLPLVYYRPSAAVENHRDHADA